MERLAAVIWGTPMLIALLAVGIVLTWRTRGVQVQKFGAALRLVGSSVSGGNRSSFQAVCTALAGTVGTGNIAGVAGAIALGGPGAVFWMWISAFFGMATKYAEVVLSLRYRVRGENSDWLGGPMYTIRQGMGERWRGLAVWFAVSTVLVSFGMGNLAQIHTMVSAVQQALPAIRPEVAALVTGAAAACFVAMVTVGGGNGIGRFLEKLVPLMAGIYVVGAGIVLVVHWRELGTALQQIVVGAFCPEAILGGGAGIGMRQALRWGVARGVFSNEAGLGSASIAHAAAETEPEIQGLFGIFEVFLDTIVLCTLTALVILVSGVPVAYGQTSGVELVASALETVLGSAAAGWLALAMGLLALATLLSWQLYGLRCAGFLWGSRGAVVYRLCYVAVILLGATMELSVVWSLSDLFNGLMCVPNLVSLMVLRRQVSAPPCKTVQFET